MKVLNLSWNVFWEVYSNQNGLKNFYTAFSQGTNPETYTYCIFLANDKYVYETNADGDNAESFESNYKSSFREVQTIDDIRALVDPSISSNGALQVEIQTKTGKLGFNQYTLCSFNFCKPTTWYQNYDQHTNVSCTPNETYTIYDSALTTWINIDDYSLSIQDYNRGGPNYGLAGVFQRDGTSAQKSEYRPVIKKNGNVVTSGYVLDYANGKITFAESLTVQDAVTATFRSVKPSGGGEFVIRPQIGKKFIIPHVELNLSTDMKLTSPVNFEIWAGDPNYSFQGDSYFLQYLMEYKSWYQLVGIGVVGKDEFTPIGGTDLVPASERTGWCPSQKSGFEHSIVEIPYDFGLEWGKAIELNSAYYTQLRIRVPDDLPLVGEYAVATFYIEEVLI